MTRDEMIEKLTSVQASCHACRWRDEVAALASVIAALRAAPPADAGARWFPIQTERGAKPHPLKVPWSVAERAYSVYAAKNGTSQSLEVLARRGGFAPSEMDVLYPQWREAADAGAPPLREALAAAVNAMDVAASFLGESGTADELRLASRKAMAALLATKDAGAPPALVALVAKLRAPSGDDVTRYMTGWNDALDAVLGTPAVKVGAGA